MTPVEFAQKIARCWKGYEPVPGKEPYSPDSCRPAGSGKKKKVNSAKNTVTKKAGSISKAATELRSVDQLDPAFLKMLRTAIGDSRANNYATPWNTFGDELDLLDLVRERELATGKRFTVPPDWIDSYGVGDHITSGTINDFLFPQDGTQVPRQEKVANNAAFTPALPVLADVERPTPVSAAARRDALQLQKERDILREARQAFVTSLQHDDDARVDLSRRNLQNMRAKFESNYDTFAKTHDDWLAPYVHDHPTLDSAIQAFDSQRLRRAITERRETLQDARTIAQDLLPRMKQKDLEWAVAKSKNKRLTASPAATVQKNLWSPLAATGGGALLGGGLGNLLHRLYRRNSGNGLERVLATATGALGGGALGYTADSFLRNSAVKQAFSPDLTAAQIIEANGGKPVPDASQGSMEKWPDEWMHGGKGWIEWYRDYEAGVRSPEDAKQIQRWKSFLARHGKQYKEKPTERRGNALRNWGIDPDKLVTGTQVPQQEKVANNVAPKKKKKRTSFTDSTPLLGLGLGAAGALSYGTANALASDAEVARLQKAIAQHRPEGYADPSKLPENQTGLTHYQATLSPGAGLRPFGVSAGKYLATIRQYPNLLKSLGIPADYVLDEKTVKGVGGLPHYNSFAQGPVGAYFHQLKARLRDTPVPEEFKAGDKTYSDWMGKKLEQFVASQAGGVHPMEINPDIMSHEDQLKLMESFHASLPDNEKQFRQTTESPGEVYKQQAGNYLKPTQAVLNARDVLKNTGITAGGAGVGAIGGHMLYNLIGDRKKKTRAKQFLASLLGAGVGGAGAFFAGTSPGRRTLLNAANMATGASESSK